MCTTDTREGGRQTLSLFVDFKTAFDTVDRSILLDNLRRLGTPDYIQCVIANLYKNTSYSIEGDRFPSYRGLKQGCPLSPLLFALYIHALDRVLAQNQLGGIVIANRKIHALAFADDIVSLKI